MQNVSALLRYIFLFISFPSSDTLCQLTINVTAVLL